MTYIIPSRQPNKAQFAPACNLPEDASCSVFALRRCLSLLSSVPSLTSQYGRFFQPTY
eukprot:m.131427 g.131427  ORF g.131427 m.131427 type:complete len:58 (-) comp15910_c0_seq1:573-746(-)